MVFMRHMESESNLVHTLHGAGVEIDPELLAQFRARPDYAQRLSERGPDQAKIVGRWIVDHLLEGYPELAGGFDAYRTSPYVRCKESAGELGIPGFGPFRREMRLRERDRGVEGPLTRQEHKQQYPVNAAIRGANPLMWIPVEGESVDHVATARVRSLLGMTRRLHEEEGAHSVFYSTHGELMMSLLAALYNWGPEEWARESALPENKIVNGGILHLSTIKPTSGTAGGDFYVRLSNPLVSPEPGDWRLVSVPDHTPADLLAQALRHERIFPAGMLTGLLNQS